MNDVSNHPEYQYIERAIEFLDVRHLEQPTLDEVAAHVGLSKHHFHRMFVRWAGTTPKRFLHFLTLQDAKTALTNSSSVLDAVLEIGLSGPGRLHDLLVTHEGVTPGEFKRNGEGVVIRFGWHPSPFGECLLAMTQRGVCGLMFATSLREQPAAPAERGFLQGSSPREALLARLHRKWPRATLVEDSEGTAPVAQTIFGGDFLNEDSSGHDHIGPGLNGTGINGPGLNGDQSHHRERREVKLSLDGTNFQMAVWKALLEIPPGEVTTYEAIAARIGRPRAVRAVGNAVGANLVAYLIPCHRVIRETGVLGGYRWGPTRKQAMIARESVG